MSETIKLKPVTDVTVAFWRSMENLPAWQAACLFFDFEPPSELSHYEKFEEGYVWTLAEELVKYRTSGGNTCNGWERRQSQRYPHIKDTVRVEPATLNREAMQKAAVDKGLKPKFLFQDESSIVKTIGLWPWGTHETELLRKLAEAAKRFWTLYDPSEPSTAPTNEQVQKWLEDNGVPNRKAEVMAQILRADGLPPGPNVVELAKNGL